MYKWLKWELLSKLRKAKFFILCDVVFLVRLQEKFDIDNHVRELEECWNAVFCESQQIISVQNVRKQTTVVE